MALASRVLLERFAFDVLGDEIPIACVRLTRPEDLYDVRVVDLAKRADLAANGFIAGGVVEQLERAFFAFHFVANSVDLREAALAEHVKDFEPSINYIADGVIGGLRPDRRTHFGRIGFGQYLAVTTF